MQMVGQTQEIISLSKTSQCGLQHPWDSHMLKGSFPQPSRLTSYCLSLCLLSGLRHKPHDTGAVPSPVASPGPGPVLTTTHLANSSLGRGMSDPHSPIAMAQGHSLLLSPRVLRVGHGAAASDTDAPLTGAVSPSIASRILGAGQGPSVSDPPGGVLWLP